MTLCCVPGSAACCYLYVLTKLRIANTLAHHIERPQRTGSVYYDGSYLRRAGGFVYAAITSSKTASTAEWPLMSLILTRVVLPWTGRSAVIARAWA